MKKQPPFSSDLINLCTNMIQINTSPKGIYNLRLEITSLSDQICNAQQNIPGLIDVLIAIQSTLLTPHQSEAAFVHEHSCFSKSRVCRQVFPYFSPSPLIPLFCCCVNFLDELTQKLLLCRLNSCNLIILIELQCSHRSLTFDNHYNSN